MTIHLSPVKQPPAPSLSATIGLYGKVHFIPQQGFWIAAEDNEAELIEVAIVKKRRLHVVTDRMLKAQADMDEPSNTKRTFNLGVSYAI